MNTSNYFSEVTDPRVTGRCLPLLSDILMIGLCTYLTGGTDYEDMRLFALECGEMLNDLLSLPNGVPSEDTFERVFQRIEPSELEHCLRSYGKSLLSDLSEKQIVIDGKKQGGTSPTSTGNKGLYILNAWVSENRFCISQGKVEDQSNEITAIPAVLSEIDIEEAIVSIDAMGTQREIVDLILDKKGHYLLSVKGNQKSLYEDIECAFKVNGGLDKDTSVDKDHGRIEVRKCCILPAREYLLAETIRSWRGPGTIIKIESSREINGKTTYETRYYISDEIGLSASYFQKLIRGHRSIGNQLHWHLDVTFKEDNCRARKGYSSQNLSVLRKVALHIVSEQKDKLSLKRRLYKAALDINYLRKLLGY